MVERGMPYIQRSLARSLSEYELHTVWHIEHRLTAMQFEFVELYRLRVWADDGDGDGGARDIAGFKPLHLKISNFNITCPLHYT